MVLPKNYIFEIGAAALRRGYQVLVFEGPGQGGALREQNLYRKKLLPGL